MRVSPTRGVQCFGIKGNWHPDTSNHLKSSKLEDQLLAGFVFLLSWPPSMMSSISLNSRSASKCPLRSLNHKISKLNPIYLILSIQSEFLTPKKEVPKGRKLKCTKSSGITILRKKPPGRLKLISKEIFPTFLEPIQVPNLSVLNLPVILGQDSF